MPTWDLLDETFTDLTDWTVLDNDTGESEIDPAGELRLDTNAGAAGDAYARVKQRIPANAFPDEFTVEIQTYFDLIGAVGVADHFSVDLRQAAERFAFRFGTNGLFAVDDGGNTEIGTDLVLSGASAEWQTWRFLISCAGTGAATCRVFLSDSTHCCKEVGTGIACSIAGSYTDGEVYLHQCGFTTDNMVSHVSYIRALTGLYDVYPAAFGQVKNGSEVIQQTGTQVFRASNGDVRVQILGTAHRHDFKVVHYLNATDKATLDTFYTDYADSEFTFVWAVDSEDYNVVFMDAPKIIPITTNLFRCEVTLLEKDTD
jgi:hypothetical protein